tara:strand:- start:167 stop:487 length:321 start_codon:yes stop_codon:yes gene_type:complete
MLTVVAEWSPSDRGREMLLNRANGVMERFEQVGDTMQKVADLQLEVMEKLRPIVDDLGELVKLSLDEARQRMDSQRSYTAQVIEHPPLEESSVSSSTDSKSRSSKK